MGSAVNLPDVDQQDPIVLDRAGLLFNLAVTTLDVGVAMAVFFVVRGTGAGDTAAYLTATVGPALGGLAVWIRARALSGASIAILAFNVLSAVVVLVRGHQPDVVLYKDAVSTGLIGMIFAGSLLLPRPLAFYLGQRYATNGTHEAMVAWRRMWRFPDFRRGNYAVTSVWAAVFLLEAVIKAAVMHSAGFDVAYAVDQIVPWVAIVLAVVLTVVVTRYYRSRG